MYLDKVVPREERNKMRTKYRALRLSPGFKIWEQAQWERQYGRCAYCKERLRPKGSKERIYQVDHIRPIYRGGNNDWDNLCLACQPCNYYKKGDMLLPGVDKELIKQQKHDYWKAVRAAKRENRFW